MAKTSKQFYSELGCKGLSKRKTFQYTRRELSYLTKLIRKDQNILDLACGYGRLTIPLAGRGYKIEGIDITPDLIKCAREKANKKGIDVNFRTGDMRDLPYKNGIFDAVICMWSAFSEIVSQTDQLRVIGEVRRILKADGFALIEVRNHRSAGLDVNYRIDGILMMPSYKHSKMSLRKLSELSKIQIFKVFTDDFGGRNRLFLQFWN